MEKASLYQCQNSYSFEPYSFHLWILNMFDVQYKMGQDKFKTLCLMLARIGYQGESIYTKKASFLTERERWIKQSQP